MGLTTAELRRAWKSYECRADAMQIVDFAGDRIRVAPPTADAWKALAMVLARHGYPVRRDDTDSYNCRAITGGSEKSLHAYGIALDVNWTTNPYKDHPGTRPPRFSGKPTQAERALDVKANRADTDMTRAMIDDALAIETVDGRRVFEWGGNWGSVKNATHFQIGLTPNDLARGIRWSSVRAAEGEAAEAAAAGCGCGAGKDRAQEGVAKPAAAPAAPAGAAAAEPQNPPQPPQGNLNAQQPPPTTGSPAMTTIDRVLGGELLTGKKTLLAGGIYAALLILDWNHSLSMKPETFDMIEKLLAILGGLGIASKIERAGSSNTRA